MSHVRFDVFTGVSRICNFKKNHQFWWRTMQVMKNSCIGWAMWIFAKDTLAEWLRRRPAKPMGSPCVGSNPTGVGIWLLHLIDALIQTCFDSSYINPDRYFEIEMKDIVLDCCDRNQKLWYRWVALWLMMWIWHWNTFETSIYRK